MAVLVNDSRSLPCDNRIVGLYCTDHNTGVVLDTLTELGIIYSGIRKRDILMMMALVQLLIAGESL